uniref:Uncharacterized protein n=1 Tax=Gloeothece verrucosa (strain PCC 7822) TaxID=497965 RepID=E0UBT3_GLOV7|nr:hypothetical protein Cyan7822_3195 [Gloeothece verrucosa PCC 7822]
MRHRASPDFWYHYPQLPRDVQELADRCYELLKQDSRYPSLHFKKVGPFWSVDKPFTLKGEAIRTKPACAG